MAAKENFQSTGIFVTGTDTGVGKTLVTCALMQALQERGGLTVAGMKPVASGCEIIDGLLRNADAQQIQAASSVQLPYSIVNPYAFAPPIAPHIAADIAGVQIDVARLDEAYAQCAAASQVVVVEGAGGWRLPLGSRRFLSDFAEALRLNVVLVVGLRLGCLNHALLTAEAVQHGPCELSGWIGNQIDPEFAFVDRNVATLKTLLDVPCLGVIPHLTKPSTALACRELDWTLIMHKLKGKSL